MKRIYLFAALLICTAYLSAKNVTDPVDIPSYYASLNNKSGTTLWSSVSSIASKNRGNLGYDGLYDAYIQTDSYPVDSVGKAGKIWDMYSECGFEHNQKKCGNYNIECDCYNREHSIPKSWFGGSTSGIGCDIFHVVPTDGKVNGMRSAYVYGEVTDQASYISNTGHKKGNGAAIYNDRKTICAAAGSTTPCSAGTVFEPIDQYKGDFARGYMGTMASWNRDMTQAEGSNFFKSTYTASTNFGLTAYGVALLMKWHREDPVSQKEIDRNNGIQATQGNRNPFIDYPYLAEYIWGEHAGEIVDMSKLIASCEVGFVPGKSSGWRGDSFDPDKPVVKCGVTWMVNGEVLQIDSVLQNGRPSVLPETPVSCSTESNVFMGWSQSPIDGSIDDNVPILYKTVGEMPVVTADITYYAVFAKEVVTSGTPATYSYGIGNETDGWINTASKNTSYWVLVTNTYIESPLLDLSGLSKITVQMRTYGGTQYCVLNVKAGETKIATIEAEGSTMKEYTWTDSQNRSGSSTLTFSSGESTSKNGVGINSITIDATGAGISYSRYITSCQSTQEVETVTTGISARKVLIGGQIYILLGEHMYNLQGQQVK